MGRRENRKEKALEEDEENEERTVSKSTIYLSSCDDSDEEDDRKRFRSAMYDESDDEGINDPTFKIIEEALLVRGKKVANDDNFGVVSIRRADGVVEFPSKEAEPVHTSVNSKAEKKKKKKSLQDEDVQNQDVADKSIEKDEADDNLEAVEGVEKVEVAELEKFTEANAVYSADNIVMRKLLRGPRYFDPPDSGWSTCFNCGEEGHMAAKCPSLQKRKKPCFVCGSLDHGAKQCPKGQDCFICKQGGHRAKDCPEKKKGNQIISKVCLKCGDTGHDLFSCRNDYSQDDLKEIKCYVCKNFGHLCCVSSINNSPKEVSCYKCGELGHTGLACSKLCDDADNAASPSSCFKCGEVGHFARECKSSAKNKKRSRDKSTFKPKARKEKGNAGSKSAPPEREKGRKKKKQKSEEKGTTNPQKSKHRGGWITEDTGEFSDLKTPNNKGKHWHTPMREHRSSIVTPGSYPSNSQYSKKAHTHYPESLPYNHGYTASRFNNSVPIYNNSFYPETSAYDHRYPAPRFKKSPAAPNSSHYPGNLSSNHRFAASSFDNNRGPLPYDQRYTTPRYGNSAAPYNNSSSRGQRNYYGRYHH